MIEVYSEGVNQGSVFIFSMKMSTIPTDEIEELTVQDDESSLNNSIQIIDKNS